MCSSFRSRPARTPLAGHRCFHRSCCLHCDMGVIYSGFIAAPRHLCSRPSSAHRPSLLPQLLLSPPRPGRRCPAGRLGPLVPLRRVSACAPGAVWVRFRSMHPQCHAVCISCACISQVLSGYGFGERMHPQCHAVFMLCACIHSRTALLEQLHTFQPELYHAERGM